MSSTMRKTTFPSLNHTDSGNFLMTPDFRPWIKPSSPEPKSSVYKKYFLEERPKSILLMPEGNERNGQEILKVNEMQKLDKPLITISPPENNKNGPKIQDVSRMKKLAMPVITTSLSSREEVKKTLVKKKNAQHTDHKDLSFNNKKRKSRVKKEKSIPLIITAPDEEMRFIDIPEYEKLVTQQKESYHQVVQQTLIQQRRFSQASIFLTQNKGNGKEKNEQMFAHQKSNGTKNSRYCNDTLRSLHLTASISRSDEHGGQSYEKHHWAINRSKNRKTDKPEQMNRCQEEQPLRKYTSTLKDVSLPIGFKNPPGSNSCWMNVSLQLILRMKYLVEYVERNEALSTDTIIDSFRNVIKHHKNKSPLISESLRHFRMSLKQWKNGYEDNSQQDAGEFIQKLFLHIQEEEKKKSLKCCTEKTIKLVLRKTLLCPKCENVNSSLESFFFFFLHLDKAEGLHNVQDAFVREMEGYSEGGCSACCGSHHFHQLHHIVEFPRYLFLQLLRYTSDLEKLDTKIQISLKLDLGHYFEESQTKDIIRNTQYHLLGVISHLGSDGKSGHYKAHIYDENSKTVITFDDAQVTQSYHFLEETERNCYILVYSLQKKKT